MCSDAPNPKRDPSRHSTCRRSAYWIALLGSWIVFLPNALGVTLPDGTPCPLWLLSPALGLIAVILAAVDRASARIVAALLFGVGAVFILNSIGLILYGP